MYKQRDFSHWMKETTKLSDASIYKYMLAVGNISKDMQSENVITKELIEMNLAELDTVIPIILNNKYFIEKNTRGNNMYSNALKQFRGFVATIDDREISYKSIIDSIEKDNRLSVTERDSLIHSRIGQGQFRDNLLKKYSSSCIVTGINLKRVLVASHIKPWAVSNNQERLSCENGFLLSATFDRLLDSGFISFKDDGTMIISHYVDYSNRSRLHISNDTKVNLLASSELLHNLEYHRDVIFIK